MNFFQKLFLKRATIKDYKPAQDLFLDLAHNEELKEWAYNEKEKFIKSYFLEYKGGCWSITCSKALTVANIDIEITAVIVLMFGYVSRIDIKSIQIGDLSVTNIPSKDDRFTCKMVGDIRDIESAMAVLRLGA